MESYMCEIGLTLSELTWMQKHLPKLMRCKTVPTPLAHFAAKSFQSPSPYGTVLIMSPWNYPVLLTLEPLIDALAAGNTVTRLIRWLVRGTGLKRELLPDDADENTNNDNEQ